MQIFFIRSRTGFYTDPVARYAFFSELNMFAFLDWAAFSGADRFQTCGYMVEANCCWKLKTP